MRVNHTGEVCAQALYDGQLVAVRDERVRKLLDRAAKEETEHLAWTQSRLDELGARRSMLNPLFYAGSFALGAFAGLLGDRWSLGFLAETERQVERHLSAHLERLPPEDMKSRAVVEQMRSDESDHALSAQREGAAELPLPVRYAMAAASRIMTATTRWV
jgi:ubiquinone biosynthesis monooxygenase Coq7